MTRLQTRLLLAFTGATVLPLLGTLAVGWVVVDRSLSLAPTEELARVSEALETVGREHYQAARQSLRRAVERREAESRWHGLATRAKWPSAVASFHEGGSAEQFIVAGPGGSVLSLLRRESAGVREYRMSLGGVRLHDLRAELARAQEALRRHRERDYRRGLFWTLACVAGVVWLLSMAALAWSASRLTRPIRQLTAALGEVAAGNLSVRIRPTRTDELGAAMWAFDRMAGQLEQSRERLLYLTRLASWQALGRKMAHELKNSLTPIRLTMEEMSARRGAVDPAFFEQAAQIVVEEVAGLERRVRAFTDFAAEPPVRLALIDLAMVLEERLVLLRRSGARCQVFRASEPGEAWALADADLVRGLLTNLLNNAAEAAGAGGRIEVRLGTARERVWAEIHDSGPGLSDTARATLFEPTISFKPAGMGLGLSIARKSALLCGGDVELVPGALGGAAFRVWLPRGQAPPGTAVIESASADAGDPFTSDVTAPDHATDIRR